MLVVVIVLGSAGCRGVDEGARASTSPPDARAAAPPGVVRVEWRIVDAGRDPVTCARAGAQEVEVIARARERDGGRAIVYDERFECVQSL